MYVLKAKKRKKKRTDSRARVHFRWLIVCRERTNEREICTERNHLIKHKTTAKRARGKKERVCVCTMRTVRVIDSLEHRT